jgi:hypothetical protein
MPAGMLMELAGFEFGLILDTDLVEPMARDHWKYHMSGFNIRFGKRKSHVAITF